MLKFSRIKKESADIFEFLSNPNLIGIIIGLIVGKAFGDMITSLIEDIIYPCIDYFVIINIDNKFIVIKNGKNSPYKTIEDAKKDGAAVISWGLFSKSIINFLINGIIIYYVIKFITKIHNKLQKNLVK